MALTYIKTSGLDPEATFNLANVSITSNLTVANANVTGSALLPNVSLTGNITPSSNNVYNLGDSTHLFNNVYAANVSATLVAGNLTTGAQPNITSVGTLTDLTASGNATATYFIGNGSQLTGLPATYANSNVASYLPTYTGDLSPGNLVVTTSANLGDIGNVTITGGTNGQVLSTDGAGALSWADQASGGGGGGTAITVDTFTGDGTTSSFTLSVTPPTVNNVIVNYNGTLVARASYSISGTTLSLGSAPALNSKIEVSTISGLSAGAATFNTRVYTGDGTDVTYVVTSGSTASTVLVTLNGSVKTPITDYTISGTVLTFATAPGAGVNIQIRELGVVVGTNSVNINTTAFRAQAMTMGIIFGR